MKPKKSQKTEVQPREIQVLEPQGLDKPQHDTEFAQAAAKILVDIIKKNNWSRKLGGQSEHISYEGWQTAGKYYGYAVKTFDAEYIEYGGTWGFKAKAVVVNEKTGIEVGGAEALCMSDEFNWKSKPKFQLASMAQTRAGSKALRQILGFVIALAGYNSTPLEEMDGVYEKPMTPKQMRENTSETPQATHTNGNGVASEKQLNYIKSLLTQKGFTEEQLKEKYEITNMTQLTSEQASTIIGNLMKLPNKTIEPEEEIDMDEVDEGIQKQAV